MRLFFDTEFTGLHQKTTLISVGMVTEDLSMGFYAEFTDYDKTQLDDWLQMHVIDNLILTNESDGYYKESFTTSPHLNSSNMSELINPFWGDASYPGVISTLMTQCKGNTSFIKSQLEHWFVQVGATHLIDINSEKHQLWSDCLAYDWMLLCELFGGAMYTPEYINYIPMDICTQFEIAGIDPDISRMGFISDIIDTTAYTQHNALSDATVIALCYLKLKQLEVSSKSKFVKLETVCESVCNLWRNQGTFLSKGKDVVLNKLCDVLDEYKGNK